VAAAARTRAYSHRPFASNSLLPATFSPSSSSSSPSSPSRPHHPPRELAGHSFHVYVTLHAAPLCSVAIKYLLFDEYANIIIYAQFRRFYASCVTLLSTQLIGVTVASRGRDRLCSQGDESESFAVYAEIGIYFRGSSVSFLFSLPFLLLLFFFLLFFLDKNEQEYRCFR